MGYYSIDDVFLRNPHILLGMDNIIDSLLPYFLPYKCTRYAAHSVKRTDNIYDSFAYAAQDHSIVAQ